MSSSLDHPLTRKSISIALAFGLRARVRAKLRGREMLPLWLGVAGCNLSGWSAPLAVQHLVGPAGPAQNHFLVFSASCV